MNAEELTALFVKRTLAIMDESGVTQAELARRMGKSRPLVSRLLAKGRSPGADTIAAVATALGVDVCELLCEPKKPKRK